jgi:hypothetical protein
VCGMRVDFKEDYLKSVWTRKAGLWNWFFCRGFSLGAMGFEFLLYWARKRYWEISLCTFWNTYLLSLCVDASSLICRLRGCSICVHFF